MGRLGLDSERGRQESSETSTLVHYTLMKRFLFYSLDVSLTFIHLYTLFFNLFLLLKRRCYLMYM